MTIPTGSLLTLSPTESRTWEANTNGVRVERGSLRVLHPTEGELTVSAGEEKTWASAPKVVGSGYFNSGAAFFLGRG